VALLELAPTPARARVVATDRIRLAYRNKRVLVIGGDTPQVLRQDLTELEVADHETEQVWPDPLKSVRPV